MPNKKKPEKEGSGISRRDFFRSGTATAVSSALLSTQAVGKSEAGVEILGPEEVEIVLNVDGAKRRLRVEPRVTLLDALRNYIDTTGAKKVCDRGSCGACTVLLDDQPVYACSYLAIEAVGKEITTAQGLGKPGDLHPVQEAFIKNDAQQCGFCTPGFVVASTALLKGNSNPSIKDIEEGLGGNLCRCGTYAGVRQAILDASQKGDFDA